MRQVGLIFIFLFILLGNSACGGGTTTSSNTSTPTAVVTNTPVTPTPLPHHKVGDQVKAGNWLIVINSAYRADRYGLYGSYNPADELIVLDVSLQNLATTSQDMNPRGFVLRSLDGTEHDLYANLGDTEGTFATNSGGEGVIMYNDVPKVETTLTLEFAPDLVDVVAIWDISA